MSTFVFNSGKKAILDGSAPLLVGPVKLMLLAGQKTGCTITDASTDITNIASTANLLAGMGLSHASFPEGTTIASVLSGTSVRASALAVGSLAGQVVTFLPEKKQDFVANFVGLELSCANYVGGHGGSGRKTISGKVVAVDDVNSQAWLDATDATWTALGTNEVVTGAALFYELGSDAESQAIAYYDSGYPITLAGIDFVHLWSAQGVLRG